MNRIHIRRNFSMVNENVFDVGDYILDTADKCLYIKTDPSGNFCSDWTLNNMSTWSLDRKGDGSFDSQATAGDFVNALANTLQNKVDTYQISTGLDKIAKAIEGGKKKSISEFSLF